MESIKISETDLIRILTDREHMLRQIKELQERGSRFVLENRRLKQQLISNNIKIDGEKTMKVLIDPVLTDTLAENNREVVGIKGLLDPRRFRKNTKYFKIAFLARLARRSTEDTPKKSLLDPRRFRKNTKYFVKRW